jgi:hypothetical protein
MQQKATRLAKGAAFAAIGGAFLFFVLIYGLHALALLLDDLLNVNPSGVWIGYAIVTGGLLLLGVIAVFVAVRLFKKGAPPTPDLAIEEAKKTRAVLEEARH